jgi:hypothetical protein
MHIGEMADAIGRAHGAALDDLTRALWAAFATGQIEEAQALRLSEAINARRMFGRSVQAAVGSGLSSAGHISRRKLQRPPERSVAIERRRRLAASGPMPPALAARFTTGQLAALKIIGDDVRDSGACIAPIDAIAARAGVCRTVVQNAIRQACRLGMLERQERRRTGANSLPSILRVVDREWRQWLARGPKRVGLTGSSTMGNRIYQKGEVEPNSVFFVRSQTSTSQNRGQLRPTSTGVSKRNAYS